MKLTSAQKQFLSDIVFPRCQELYLIHFTVGEVLSEIKSSRDLEMGALDLFNQCLESFELDLIPACSSLSSTFISYFEGQLKFQLVLARNS